MVDEHNGIAPENKDNVFNAIISEEYVQQLLKSVEEEKTQYGSVDHYLNKIYLSDAIKGAAEYKDGAETYKQKRAEQEAYYIGNNAKDGLDGWSIPIKYK